MNSRKVIFALFAMISMAAYSQEYDDYENKTALVIGNTNYQIGKLRNPVNDANALSATLENLGFKVIKKLDLDKAGLREAIREFGDEIRNNDGIALFYYSGHGLQNDGVNYLVPIDADLKEEWEIEDQCVSSDHVLRMLNSYQNPFNIIILDACRNNPFESRYRSATRGLAQPEIVPTGSIMAFSTAPGKVASDGSGENGLYTQELIKAMATPGLDIEGVFKQTRIAVKQISLDEQIPWETSSLIGDFYFVPDGSEALSIPIVAKPDTSEPEIAEKPLEQVEPKMVYREKGPDGKELEVFVDPRTSKEYSIIQIGESTWMTKNMDFVIQGSKWDATSKSRYYTWDAAREACPVGWHLAKNKEFVSVMKLAGGYSNAGAVVKSKLGWTGGGNGTNANGFNVRADGYILENQGLQGFGNIAMFWVDKKGSRGQAMHWVIRSERTTMGNNYTSRGNYLSVRCVKDTED